MACSLTVWLWASILPLLHHAHAHLDEMLYFLRRQSWSHDCPSPVHSKGHMVPPTKDTEFLKMAWSSECLLDDSIILFVPFLMIVHSYSCKIKYNYVENYDFSLCKIPFRNTQFHQSAPFDYAMATIQLFSIILKSQISIVFKYFHLKAFLWDNLSFGYYNTLRSFIKAQI